MIKRYFVVPALLTLCVLHVDAQVGTQEPGLKREVTLYNPYKPSLPDVIKRSFLPDMNDTTKVRPTFNYVVRTEPFMPEYTVSPIRAASLLPEPLPKLYRSYVNIGLGTFLSPLAEISITNERSKKGAIGFYGRHFSTNGKVELDNSQKVFAGYMDNEASLFGRKFFRKSLIEGSVNFLQRTRYAYGYDTSIVDYIPEKKDIRLTYNNMGAEASFSSIILDSSSFSYKFDLHYDYFYNGSSLFQHSAGFKGYMAKSFKGFYVGSGIGNDIYIIPEKFLAEPKFIASLSPFIKKSTDQWNFKLGFQALVDKNMTSSPLFHIYPDIEFGFSVVPFYIYFFTGLSGHLERNEPLSIISDNPFIIRDGSLFEQPNTDHELVVKAGLKGNTGLGGNYLVSASYSLISDMLFYTNIVFPDTVFTPGRGNYFAALTDDIELLNIHAEMNGAITDKLSFYGVANIDNYSLAEIDYPWNKPSWNGRLGLKYNLRDKIIAGMELTGEGKRRMIINGDLSIPTPLVPPYIIEVPAHFNLNLSAEYRYSKILSVWTRFNNISYNRYYEWAYYPSKRFLFMVGFTYSL